MPRKKPKTEEAETLAVTKEKVDFGEPFETKKEKVVVKSMVKVQVLVGTLQWEGGIYEKGQIFECTPEQATKFEAKDIKVIE